MDQLLTDALKAEAVMVAVKMTVQFLVLGHKIAIASQVFHPQAHISDAAALLEAFEQGAAAGRPFEMVGVDGSPFRMFALDRQHGDAPLLPQRLGIEGYPPEDQQPGRRFGRCLSDAASIAATSAPENIEP